MINVLNTLINKSQHNDSDYAILIKLKNIISNNDKNSLERFYNSYLTDLAKMGCTKEVKELINYYKNHEYISDNSNHEDSQDTNKETQLQPKKDDTNDTNLSDINQSDEDIINLIVDKINEVVKSNDNTELTNKLNEINTQLTNLSSDINQSDEAIINLIVDKINEVVKSNDNTELTNKLNEINTQLTNLSSDINQSDEGTINLIVDEITKVIKSNDNTELTNKLNEINTQLTNLSSDINQSDKGTINLIVDEITKVIKSNDNTNVTNKLIEISSQLTKLSSDINQDGDNDAIDAIVDNVTDKLNSRLDNLQKNITDIHTKIEAIIKSQTTKIEDIVKSQIKINLTAPIEKHVAQINEVSNQIAHTHTLIKAENELIDNVLDNTRKSLVEFHKSFTPVLRKQVQEIIKNEHANFIKAANESYERNVIGWKIFAIIGLVTVILTTTLTSYLTTKLLLKNVSVVNVVKTEDKPSKK